MKGDKVRPLGFVVQSLSTLCIAYLTCLTGFIYAWPSYNVENFRSNETVLSHPMSTMEISLLGSLTNIGALVATPFCGYIVDAFGRKYSAMLFGVPNVIVWSLIAYNNYVPLILAAVTLTGVSAAGQVVSSVYISEICQISIRGAMASTTVSGFYFGVLISYILGGYLTYKQVILTHLSMSILYVLMLTLLKESPVFLMKQGKQNEAAKAIAFYRQVDVTSKDVALELRKIKLQLDPRIDEILHGEADPEVATELGNKTISKAEKKTLSSWQFLKKSESSRRALIVALSTMTFAIMMGSIVLQVYAEPLFKEAVPSMPSSLFATFLALDFLVASILCGILVDKFGRKTLMVWSSIFSGVSTCILGSQLHLHWAPHWVTVFLIFFYCFVFTLGAAIVPFIITAEVFLPEVRGLGNSMSMACMWISNFLVLIVFNPIVESLGLGPLFYGFSVICFLAALYTYFCLPETKGLSVTEIQIKFLNKKS